MYRITISNGETVTVLHEHGSADAVAAAGRFAEEVNQIPSAAISILPFNPCWGLLNERKTIVTITNTLTGEEEFEGPLLRSGERMAPAGEAYKSLVCEGYLGYLCDSIQPYHHYEGSTVTEFLTALLDNHNSVMPEEKRIYLGSCDISGDNTNSKTTAYRNTLEEIRENLINRIGGEIRIRKAGGRLVLDFLTQYGSVCDTTIELAKNIQSVEVSSDPSNIISRLIPLGYQLHPEETAERLTIAEVNDGSIYIDDAAAMAKYGVIVGTAVFDDITIPANLKAAGQSYLANNNRARKAFQAQVVDLSVLDPSEQSLKAGNTYRFRNSLIDLDEDLRLMKRTVDIYKPYEPEIEIGDKAERITDISVRTARLIEYDMPKQKHDILASAKATATDLINAGINGYVAVNGNEILIMDTPDKDTATKVWRWNSGGFGYSNTGYSGPYNTAITMNGAIVADFITAGVLRGMEINNGNGAFHVDENGNVSASSVQITGGKIDMTTESVNSFYIHIKNPDNGMILQSGMLRFSTPGVGTTGTAAILHRNGLDCYSSFTPGSVNSDPIIQLRGTTGDILANNLLFYKDNSGIRASLSALINNILSRLEALEGN